MISPEQSPQLVPLDLFIHEGLGTDLIDGVLPAKGLVVVQGDVCDILANDLMMHAAYGKSWHGQAVPRPLRVAYLPGRIRGADKAWLRAWQERADEQMKGDLIVIPGLDPYSLPIEELSRNLKRYQPDLLIVTLSSFHEDFSEDSEQSSDETLRSLKDLGHALDCTVLVCDFVGGISMESFDEHADLVISTDDLTTLGNLELPGSWLLDVSFHYYTSTPQCFLPTLTFLGYSASTLVSHKGASRKAAVDLIERLPSPEA